MVWSEQQLLHGGKYKIEKILGRGAFGITYKAVHQLLNQDVVIKTPHESLRLAPDYPNYGQEFIKHGQLLAQLSADLESLVQVRDLFQEGDTYCLVMDFISGESLWNLVQRTGPLPETDAVEYITQIGSALNLIHGVGLVHLDISPHNIVVSNSGKAVLIDFGIPGDILRDSNVSSHIDNKPFRPYELYYQGSRHATVDVYSLAASMYHAVTGLNPTESIYRKYDGEELVPPKQLVPSISDRLNQVILQGMALEPKDRPQSVQQWLQPLSEKDYFISLSEADDLSSDVGVDYRPLRDLLIRRKWQEADQETLAVMLKAAGREEEGWLDIPDINTFPCTDLYTLNTLWVKYSNGRFGFSVQKQIWQSLVTESVQVTPGADYEYETYCRFGDQLGWHTNEKWLDYVDLPFTLNAPQGHLPVSYVGFFSGWAYFAFFMGGVSLFSRLEICSI
ncbi:hypothetical protein BJP34_03610 [Moorena producens PAL-8-15-08-1]|uniref:Protein kinase domain-containing protein n=1 Tax=Moorena producens PAL-8-15-08-1 TaxID=1458985 RepID=A0A1D8TM16_9CYAN|nr:serine/threonine-protein kinase [Moorena producens]AOW98654.1 hypothetical protein BJP34_03610 [Moorena producens PAL-8-15-08-1]